MTLRGEVLTWALGMRLQNERGEPLEWRDHRFLVDPLCDLHPWQVIVKCSQVGLSTVNILRSTFLAQALGMGIIYTLPTQELRDDFNATKIAPLLRHNPGLRPTMADGAGKRVYDEGFVLYRGTFGEREQISITADLLVADEADRSNLAVLHGLESRLMASKYRGQWWFSNPSRPHVGTDLLWQLSDQRRWHVTCPGCRDEQPLDPWANIDREREVYCCRRCQAELSNEARRMGRWLATNPGASRWHGYHMNQLMAPWISASELVEAERTKPKEYVYNFLWGLPVIGDGLSVDPGLLMRSQVWPVPDEMASPLQRFAGIDVGGALHVVLGTEHGITRALTLHDEPGTPPVSKWDKLDKLMAEQAITMAVVDNAPAEKQTELQQRWRHKLLRCVYDYNDRRQETWETDRAEGILHAHRTRIIDEVIDGFAKGELPILMEQHDPWLAGTGKPGSIENCLTGHWSTLYVVGADGQDVNLVKRDRMGNVIRTWENAGPDHFAHATVYWYLARQAGRHLGLSSPGAILPGGVRKPHPRRNIDEFPDDDDQGRRLRGPRPW